MRFVFTARFFILLALGLGLLALGWINRGALYLTILYDLALIAAAVVDYFISEKAKNFRVERETEDRYSMGAENQVSIKIRNLARRKITFIVKDEYPPQMELLNPREARLTVPPGRARTWSYELLPTARGNYSFGNTVVRFRTRFGLAVAVN